MEGSWESWLPFILVFRIAFRFITLLDSVLGIVLFYNSPLFLRLPGFLLIAYPFLMGALELYLIWLLGRGSFPRCLLLVYFSVALVFEFPYAPLSAGETGIALFVMVWYLSAIVGFVILMFCIGSLSSGSLS